MAKKSVHKTGGIKKTVACRYFLGEKPCRFHKKCKDRECRDFKSFGKRILIIKFAAIGDVLRTTPILPLLKKRYPVSHITWLTTDESMPVLENNPYVDRIYTAGFADTVKLACESFDLVISLDKSASAAAIASIVKAGEKKGFGLSREGNLSILNGASDYSFRLGFEDELKFVRNRKTYQEIIIEMCGLDKKYGGYILEKDEGDTRYARELFRGWNIKDTDTAVGLNTGSGKVFKTKIWSADSFVKLAGFINKRLKAKVLLLGGPGEVEANRYIASRVKGSIINTGNNHSVKQFTEIIGLLDLVVASDTLAMHLAISRGVPVVALFGSTSSHEVDLYGKGLKIFKNLACAPCYKAECADMKCMKLISPEEVFGACKAILG